MYLTVSVPFQTSIGSIWISVLSNQTVFGEVFCLNPKIEIWMKQDSTYSLLCLYQKTGQEELLHKHIWLLPFLSDFFLSLFILPFVDGEGWEDSAFVVKFCLQSSRWYYGFTVALLLKTMNVRFSVYHMSTQHECQQN